MQQRCPICGIAIGESARAPYRPFCSARCRGADLHNWLDGRYRIPAALEDEGGSGDLGGLDAGTTREGQVN